jgi:hypothetical protein
MLPVGATIAHVMNPTEAARKLIDRPLESRLVVVFRQVGQPTIASIPRLISNNAWMGHIGV